MNPTTKMGHLLGLAGVIAGESAASRMVERGAARAAGRRRGGLRPRAGHRPPTDRAPRRVPARRCRRSRATRSWVPPRITSRDVVVPRALGGRGRRPRGCPAAPRPRRGPGPGLERRAGGELEHRAGPGHPGTGLERAQVRGAARRPLRPGRQRPAAREHGRLRLAHRDGRQHVVGPAVPHLRLRAAVLQPVVRHVPVADPPRRPRAHHRAPPARLRHGRALPR